MRHAAMTDNTSPRAPARVLALNAGSSSLKYALYDAAGTLRSRIHDTLERTAGRKPADALFETLARRNLLDSIDAVGHRVVHGGTRYSAPAFIDDTLIRELYAIGAYSPEHLPAELELIEGVRKRLPDVRQVACFDTAFHRDMPRVAQLLPLPRRFDAKGVRRFGFHGLSYAFLMEELERLAGRAGARGRVVLAHLGSGSSLAAVHDGRSLDTTMAFTPTAGVPMSTRTGDLDPGLAWFLARTEGMDAEAFHRLVNHESGLLGVSETSADMRELLARETSDVRAAEAVAMYCYQVAKAIGALAVALGGLDTLVFAGGIGERAPPVRRRICERLGFLGVTLDDAANDANATVISDAAGAVRVRVIPTDEQTMIARATYRLLQEGIPA
jgi:acetate kinase